MSGLTKRCWTCEATTLYEVGWCKVCYSQLDSTEKQLNVLSWIVSERLGGAIRMALCDELRIRFFKNRPKLNLDELDI